MGMTGRRRGSRKIYKAGKQVVHHLGWLLGVHGALEAQPAHVPQLRYGQDVLHEGCLGYMSYCTAATDMRPPELQRWCHLVFFLSFAFPFLFSPLSSLLSSLLQLPLLDPW